MLGLRVGPQDGKQTHMSLDGPLGAGGVQVTSDGSAVSIVTSRGERFGQRCC